MADDIRKKIAALRRKSVDAGSSEAEALAAAAKAAELMRDHGLSELDIEYDEQAVPITTRGGGARDQLWGAVGRCTNSAPLLDCQWDPVIIFVGHAPGPEIACYLVEVLNRAIDREIAAFKKTPEFKRRRTISTKRAAVRDFTSGLVRSLRGKLIDLFIDTVSTEAFDEARRVVSLRFPHTETFTPPASKTRYGAAAFAGYQAGGRVNISHGVNGGRPAQKIGRG